MRLHKTVSGLITKSREGVNITRTYKTLQPSATKRVHLSINITELKASIKGKSRNTSSAIF